MVMMMALLGMSQWWHCHQALPWHYFGVYVYFQRMVALGSLFHSPMWWLLVYPNVYMLWGTMYVGDFRVHWVLISQTRRPVTDEDLRSGPNVDISEVLAKAPGYNLFNACNTEDHILREHRKYLHIKTTAPPHCDTWAIIISSNYLGTLRWFVTILLDMIFRLFTCRYRGIVWQGSPHSVRCLPRISIKILSYNYLGTKYVGCVSAASERFL